MTRNRPQTADEIREMFTRFFEERGHLHLPSASLVPHGDPTLLFTSAGMVPFKPYFMGLAEPPAPRMTSVQKVFRTTDIEEVGDFSHLTCFQMLGNFSIGDYFKKEAIAWAWELLTKGYRLPPEKLHVTIFETDDEAYGFWREQGVADDHIYRFGEDKNYWFSGDIGPCGPNSEIFVERGARTGCERCAAGTCTPNAEPECGRFLEIWNLVFMTLYQAEDGTRTELPRKNIDTGSGLERVCVALQGKETIYETDMFAPIIARIEELSGKPYGRDATADKAMRVVAEHTRAATFLITDGVLPSNDGRGYVLRRILRRAVYFLTQIAPAAETSLLDRVAEAVIERLRRGYPDIGERAEFVMRLLASEEAKFRETLERGRVVLVSILTGATSRGLTQISGHDVFRLYDTFGYPLELTREIAREYGYDVDLEGFEQELEAQRERGRSATKFEYEASRIAAYTELAQVRSAFVGYDRTEHDSTVVAIVGPEGPLQRAEAGDAVELILLETPFYPEGGGQVGDTGEIASHAWRFSVEDTQSPTEGLIVHRGRIAEGAAAVRDAAHASVEISRRRASQRNHTATHLLHAALREVLGSHVKQAGSLVAPDRLRFDFTHIEAPKPEELAAAQRLVNEKIREDIEVHPHEESYDDALAGGAMALFGEKYSAKVRVVDICETKAATDEPHPCFSRELCGGTHCHRTGEIGTFIIESEGSVGSGLRRIEARTGTLADQYIEEQQALLARLSRQLAAPASELPSRIDALRAEADAERRRAQQFERQAGRAEVDTLVSAAERVDGASVVVSRVPAESVEAMREMADLLRDKLGTSVVILGAVLSERPNFLAMVSKDLTPRVHAGNLIKKIAAVTGGGGGGRPEMAQAGGKDGARLDEALSLARDLARESLASK